MKDHEISQMTNLLRMISMKYHDSQQLRARISEVLLPVLKEAQSFERNADRYIFLRDVSNETWLALVKRSGKTADEVDALVDDQIQRGAHVRKIP